MDKTNAIYALYEMLDAIALTLSSPEIENSHDTAIEYLQALLSDPIRKQLLTGSVDIEAANTIKQSIQSRAKLLSLKTHINDLTNALQNYEHVHTSEFGLMYAHTPDHYEAVLRLVENISKQLL